MNHIISMLRSLSGGSSHHEDAVETQQSLFLWAESLAEEASGTAGRSLPISQSYSFYTFDRDQYCTKNV